MTVTANWYHCSVKPISRSSGRSAVAAAAYRIGEKLYDERTKLEHDYTRRKGVEAHFIVAPSNASNWVNDPQNLWNAAEATEKRCNSQTAREVELALPSEVGKEGREQIAKDFATHLVERYQVAVMVALHEPSKHGDDRNYHAHIMMTTRRMEAEGLGSKTRELDDRKTGGAEVLHIREYAAQLINEALENAGSDNRIDHRSFKDRGIEKIPTKHLSLEAIAMEKRGERSDQGDRKREIEEANANIQNLLNERSELDRQITEQEIKIQSELEKKAERLQAKKSSTYWQDRIKAERETNTDSEDENRPNNSQENKSIFDEPSIKQYKTQIQEDGIVKQQGLIGKWYEQATEWVQELLGTIARTWEDFIKEKSPDNSPDNEPDNERDR
jgi:hypothetical protein